MMMNISFKLMTVINTVLGFYLTGHKVNKSAGTPDWYHVKSDASWAIGYVTKFIDALIGKTKEDGWSAKAFNCGFDHDAYFKSRDLTYDSLDVEGHNDLAFQLLVIGMVARMVTFGFQHEDGSEAAVFSELVTNMFYEANKESVVGDPICCATEGRGWHQWGEHLQAITEIYIHGRPENAATIISDREIKIAQKFKAGL